MFGGVMECGFRVQRANTGGNLQRLTSDPIGKVHNRNTAVLCKRPRSLKELWMEYKFGIDGNKPAEQFTSKERNNVAGGIKQRYYRRRVVWNCIERLINQGHTLDAAVTKIRGCYGNRMSVTQVINAMLRDRRITGGHPNLGWTFIYFLFIPINTSKFIRKNNFSILTCLCLLDVE
jgi:hypothetical protein